MTEQCQNFHHELLSGDTRSPWDSAMEGHYAKCSDCRALADLHLAALDLGTELADSRESDWVPPPVLPDFGASRSLRAKDRMAFPLGWAMAGFAALVVFVWGGAFKSPTPQVSKLTTSTHNLRAADLQKQKERAQIDRGELSLPYADLALFAEQGDRDSLQKLQEQAFILLQDLENERTTSRSLPLSLAKVNFQDAESLPNERLPSSLEPLGNLVNELSPKGLSTRF